MAVLQSAAGCLRYPRKAVLFALPARCLSRCMIKLISPVMGLPPVAEVAAASPAKAAVGRRAVRTAAAADIHNTRMTAAKILTE